MGNESSRIVTETHNNKEHNIYSTEFSHSGYMYYKKTNIIKLKWPYK